MNKMENVQLCLGKKFKDCVTGFEGTCLEVKIKLYASDEALLVSSAASAEGYERSEWVDVERLRVSE